MQSITLWLWFLITTNPLSRLNYYYTVHTFLGLTAKYTHLAQTNFFSKIGHCPASNTYLECTAEYHPCLKTKSLHKTTAQ